jgi:hypothetical protein
LTTTIAGANTNTTDTTNEGKSATNTTISTIRAAGGGR